MLWVPRDGIVFSINLDGQLVGRNLREIDLRHIRVVKHFMNLRAHDDHIVSRISPTFAEWNEVMHFEVRLALLVQEHEFGT
jgi:hypothetical protein